MKFNKAFTIIELITAFALVGLISVLVASIYFAHFKLFSNESASIDVNSQNKLAIDDITNQLRESQAIVANCCGGIYTTSATTLVLQLWPIDSSPQPIDPGTSNYDYIIYQRDATDNTKLDKIIVPSSISTRHAGTNVISTDISNLQFTYNNPTPSLATEVTVSVTTTATSYGKTQTTTQTGNGTLRNR